MKLGEANSYVLGVPGGGAVVKMDPHLADEFQRKCNEFLYRIKSDGVSPETHMSECADILLSPEAERIFFELKEIGDRILAFPVSRR